jgi:hypothetical protein
MQTEGQVRTWEEFKQATGTHGLESADQGTSQDMGRVRASDGHSLSGERRQRDKLGHGKNPSEWVPLTIWRAQTEGQVKTQKESEQARGTYPLESVGRGTNQDTTRKASERVRDTHVLESADRETCQDTERI